MDPEKVQAVETWEAPEETKEVQAFLGFANLNGRPRQGTMQKPGSSIHGNS
jgi:hypothetical protein